MTKKYTRKQIIKKTEDYAKLQLKDSKDYDVHGWRHVDSVRKWAKKIGKLEKFEDMFLLEITALLHDVGRQMEKPGLNHYVAGEKMAKKFLKSLNYFSEKEIETVSTSVREHGPGGKSKLTKILQDADRMDLWGAIYLARVFSHYYYLPYYNNKSSFVFKKLTPDQIQKICRRKRKLKCVFDHINLVLNIYYNEINTKSARKLAKGKIEFTKRFIKQLKKETIDL